MKLSTTYILYSTEILRRTLKQWTIVTDLQSVNVRWLASCTLLLVLEMGISALVWYWYKMSNSTEHGLPFLVRQRQFFGYSSFALRISASAPTRYRVTCLISLASPTSFLAGF